MIEIKKQKTRDKWIYLIAEFEKGNLSIVEFCQKYGIARSSFTHYKSLLKSQNIIPLVQQDSPLFSEIKITPPEVRESHASHDFSKSLDIKIKLPNGFECTIPSTLNGYDLKRLMGVLLSC